MREFISDDRVTAFVQARTGIVLCPGQYTQLGIIRDGKVTAGIVFNHYTGHDIHVTAATSPGAFTKEFLRRVGAYLWDELKLARFSVTTEQPAVVDLIRRVGGQIEGIKRDAFGPGRDATMLGVLRKDWKFR